MNTPDGQRYFRRAGLPFRKLDDQMFIVNPAGRQVHMLNGTAAQIWDLLAHQLTIEDLVRRLYGEEAFDAAPDVVTGDVAAFVSDLVSKGLVQPAVSPAAAQVSGDLGR